MCEASPKATRFLKKLLEDHQSSNPYQDWVNISTGASIHPCKGRMAQELTQLILHEKQIVAVPVSSQSRTYQFLAASENTPLKKHFQHNMTIQLDQILTFCKQGSLNVHMDKTMTNAQLSIVMQ